MGQDLNDKYIEDYIDRSAALRNLSRSVSKLAHSDIPVFIVGERGTEKDIIAHLIFKKGIRGKEPLTLIDCDEISTAKKTDEIFIRILRLFYKSNGGTVILRNVDSASTTLQNAILQAIKSADLGEIGTHNGVNVSTRMITTSMPEIEKQVKAKAFRKDLYYLLNVGSIKVPPLRDRREDIPELIEHYLQVAAVKCKKRTVVLDSRSLNLMKYYIWPGNLIELQSSIEHIVAANPGEIILPEHLPEKFVLPEDNILWEQKKDAIQRVLKESCNDKKMAARLLDVDLSTLYRYIKQFGIRK